VIVGGGFGGLAAARRLGRSGVDVTLIDRRNHHLFQPLLYQVATAALSPADIAQPIRHILARQRNIRVVLGEATGIDVDARRVSTHAGAFHYDYLVVAAGSTSSYFGHDDWSAHAPALKTVDDALEIRRRFLVAFEAAERETDDDARRAELTFVVIGAGPTGVELAGAMIEIARRAMPRDFRFIDTKQLDTHLTEHVKYLQKYYKLNVFVASGRKVPRTGGIILALAKSREAVDAIIQEDPFYIHKLAEFSVTEFLTSQSHPDLKKLLKG
jgi:NADH dehydrogenase